MNTELHRILHLAPVVPVITVRKLEQAVPLARALLAGGIPVLEITLRTAVAFDAIRLIKKELPEAVVGAGTVLNFQDLDRAVSAGSAFVISPGVTPKLLHDATLCGVPYMPGIATVSELMTCLEHGLKTVKFFPAEAAGGVKTLKALATPFPDVRFCPTGGIDPNNLADYMAMPAVLSVGGSWLVAEHLLENGQWQEITQLAKQAVAQVAALRAAHAGQ